MKETKVINEIEYHVTAKELTLIHKTSTRLRAYKEADYLKDLGYTGITVSVQTKNISIEIIEENYEQNS